jgi:hypothetical protein
VGAWGWPGGGLGMAWGWPGGGLGVAWAVDALWQKASEISVTDN